MAGTLERIEKDLVVLGEVVATLAAEFDSNYSTYLESLGQAVRQQLILASYHICTQGYPDAFVRLPFSQRQQLQKSLREMAEKAQTQLPLLVENVSSSAGQESESDDTNAIANTINTPTPITNPEQLGNRIEKLEEAIAQTLHQLSRNSNRLLQQSEILPPQLPEEVLEVAAQADGSGENVLGQPNLLNLVMETENPQEPESAKITQILAIRLRLSEIEFADTSAMANRNQIRHLSSRLSTLRREYHKKQRERTIAEAEAAWRSSWFEE
ncbi:hypothetical protein Cri9333_2129 [Crinalium epipsammum PCC 9333]|uniref:Uncharacterized protein n=1 Tax=Crinalium epipsammum PCC 9333 TaxID=1173022 RepID=K9VYF3_9CYAN|nr:hypothetical protein [Crinalium epipsammum]AFZ13006.1 hypothetical protein Cri9333_2129 [Crinalium epipsammum PCC 9333]